MGSINLHGLRIAGAYSWQMKARPPSLSLIASPILFALTILCSGPAFGQVATDGSVGQASNLGSGGVLIRDTLGTRKGANLFHSFSRFDVGSSDVAVFGVPNGVENVISRVTGGDASTINGLVSFADPSFSIPAVADFWFFNPNGVVIGPDAQFRTNGALFFSGGDTLSFGDGATLSANPVDGLSLSSSRPEAFGFLGREPGPVTLSSATLLSQGGVLSLSGGDILIDRSSIFADGGDDIVIFAGSRGDVAPARGGAADTSGGSITIIGDGGLLSGRQTGSVTSIGGGAIQLTGGEVSLDNAFALTTANGANGGDITVHASALTLSSNASLGTLTTSAFDAGAVEVDAREILLTTGGSIRSQAQASGNAGGIVVRGFDTLTITRDGVADETAIESEVATSASGDAGRILISGGALSLLDGGRILSSTFGAGDAGSIEVNATRIVGLDGAQIASGTLDVPSRPGTASGAGGSVSVRASESIFFSGVRRDSPLAEPEASGLFSGSEGLFTAAGGDVFASAPVITVTNDAEIGAETFNASPAGDVTLQGRVLSVSDGAEISTTSRTSGVAGNVRLNFSREIILTNGGVVASRALGDGGAAGRVAVTTGDLSVRDGSQITTASLSSDGGSISITASGVTVVDSSSVSTSVGASVGDGGAIEVFGGPLVLRNEARLESSALRGDGGTVTIASEVTFIETNSLIDVSSALGQDGSISILGIVGTQSSETEPPPAEFFNRFALIDDFCVAAVTSGSALRLAVADTPVDNPAPVFFGGAVPYPVAGQAAAPLVLALDGSKPCGAGG